MIAGGRDGQAQPAAMNYEFYDILGVKVGATAEQIKRRTLSIPRDKLSDLAKEKIQKLI